MTAPALWGGERRSLGAEFKHRQVRLRSAKRGRGGGGGAGRAYTVETEVGARPPFSRAASPNGDTPTTHCLGETREKKWSSGSLPEIRFSTGYRHTLPPPLVGGGGAPEARAGWGLQGGADMVKTGTVETGEGETPPVSPSPVAIPPRSTVRGEPKEEPYTASHWVSPYTTAPAPWGGNYRKTLTE